MGGRFSPAFPSCQWSPLWSCPVEENNAMPGCTVLSRPHSHLSLSTTWSLDSVNTFEERYQTASHVQFRQVDGDLTDVDYTWDALCSRLLSLWLVVVAVISYSVLLSVSLRVMPRPRRPGASEPKRRSRNGCW